ncbi:LytR/AlgR family response regulator transcription factor [Mucilaginibacter myungsuensis]|uniref:LytTR family transcriptional regulator DNA-binding domain-containing protein n=1 Tax=Mucilaginibacter myungsuensis TaxID=649104 RepID=A0A929KV15_9SPHI|nr:LytTR family transcriptional regulator DNA-binding domain-containing protein [Mucilaginibacter myungsuensis]MBE9661692.1 LytTR family transcriptional regulator DNA-binding domain-containing protein [Mucilaginibacter myungsuensis]MDN3597836.1 LytTR family transcriptional regulator DNA-binding domain-containing protein [Mucilaginibacter myungsuensis]
MKKLRCLIIDDKPLAIDILADYASKVSFLELVGSATDPVQGLEMIRQQRTDLVFLDIQMPQLTGLQLMKIAGPQCKFILTTAYAEYALDGYEHDVVDYLLKPISFDKFYRAAEKALSRFAMPTEVQAPLTTPPSPEYIFVKTEHRIQKINLADVLYIEGVQNYVSIHTPAARVMTLQTLKRIEEQLPLTEFIRVHRSYIVNLRHINSVERGRIFIGDTIIPVGDNYREGFYKVIDKG